MKLVGTQGSAGATRSVAGGRGRHFDGLAGPTEQSARALASPHGILGHAARAIEGTHGICGACPCSYTNYARSCSWPRRSNKLASETHAAGLFSTGPSLQHAHHLQRIGSVTSPQVQTIAVPWHLTRNACLTFDLTFNCGLEHVPSGPRTACPGLQSMRLGKACRNKMHQIHLNMFLISIYMS